MILSIESCSAAKITWDTGGSYRSIFRRSTTFSKSSAWKHTTSLTTRLTDALRTHRKKLFRIRTISLLTMCQHELLWRFRPQPWSPFHCHHNDRCGVSFDLRPELPVDPFLVQEMSDCAVRWSCAFSDGYSCARQWAHIVHQVEPIELVHRSNRSGKPSAEMTVVPRALHTEGMDFLQVYR